MLDGAMRRLIDPALNRGGRWLAARGATADGITLLGLGFGLLAAAALAAGLPGWLALLPLVVGRVLDGLDGAVARATFKTDFGGYFDIFCDFVFYAAIPLAFVMRDPAENAVAGAFLLAAFYANAASFLGYAIIAAKRGMTTTQQGEKSLYYAVGLLEGTETIAFFVLICLFPGLFAPAALIFGGLCLVTAAARVVLARRVFFDAPSGAEHGTR
ncbi:CDP-alcohol phosphatidyltransferase family protein [Pseudotabrizicola algicola]|uniref:CDP-alcohol phosphatidyltransferase family protein n=1 Tax=Pseudotabrizicola algicola TaxID=2709381 RepID=A0A6B3RGT1_9RHOB|nr:CDP-alcohol phosphatidyltransferase family protein [Pseudotabrizicola algicola]NEX44611.1 CDP-alcohol phosphatidyltransferase family protein [Pseudotabrizicola algicola]